MNTPHAETQKRRFFLTTVMTAVLLCGCGGGGGDGSSPKVSFVLKGTVAVGKPVAGAIVRATCTQTTVTSTPTTVAGEYQIEAPSMPCILSTTSSDGSVLRSMATVPGTVNITPFTELIATHSALDFLRLNGSTQSVSEYLQLLGVNTGTNPITTPFKADGLGHDAELDRLSSIIETTAPLTAAGSTATNTFIAQANNAMLSATNGDPILANLAKYRATWTSFWTKVGASDQTFGFVKGTEDFIAKYSTKLAGDFKRLPEQFHTLTNSQTDTLEGFVRGWRTCGYQAEATGAECALGRLSAVIVDLGYHWVGTAAVTAGQVAAVPAELALDASFTWYDSVTTSMVSTYLKSGSISADEYAAFVEVNSNVQGYAKEVYKAVRIALDAKEAIEKINVGVRALRRNFAGKNVGRLSNIAKIKDPFKKMIGGTKDSFLAMKGSVDSWTESDKQLLKTYLDSLGSAIVDEVFDGTSTLACTGSLTSTGDGLCVPGTTPVGDTTLTISAASFDETASLNIAVNAEPGNTCRNGLVYNAPPYLEAPNSGVWLISVSASGRYLLEVEYAAEMSRPIDIRVNATLVYTGTLAETTGGWCASDSAWKTIGEIVLVGGENRIRFERSTVFPHLKSLRFTRIQ